MLLEVGRELSEIRGKFYIATCLVYRHRTTDYIDLCITLGGLGSSHVLAAHLSDGVCLLLVWGMILVVVV